LNIGDARHTRLAVTDWIPLAGTVLAAAAAGYVALRVHRQRLHHELVLDEIDTLRQLLAEGAQLLQDGFNLQRAHMDRMEVSETAVNTPSDLDRRWLDFVLVAEHYANRLGLWFADDYPLVVHWATWQRELAAAWDAASRMESQSYESHRESAATAGKAWMAAARTKNRPLLDVS
jgi:hypothetical protein